jgi:hypothetical protein
MLATGLVLAALILRAADGPAPAAARFSAPEPVEITGYVGHAMEPFLSRDGRWLFFNSRNQPGDETDLHLAERVSRARFDYLGPLDGANSAALDGVPSLDEAGGFYFVSPRAYDETRNTLWRGVFDDGAVTDIAPLPGSVSRDQPLWLNMDAEISADGERLYFTENRWRLFGGGVIRSNIFVAQKNAEDGFAVDPRSEEIFANVNTRLMEFAPATSEDELTLYFTRVDRDALRQGREDGFGLYVSTRSRRGDAFSTPSRIEAIQGYVEGPTISPDGCDLYFHKRVDDRFVIRLARRSDCPDPE